MFVADVIGIDDDIPETLAPPVPRESPALLPGDTNIYSQLPLTKKPSLREKPSVNTQKSEDTEEGPPPVPPRMYIQEAISNMSTKQEEAIDKQQHVTPEASKRKLKINFDDDPDAIYASIEFEPGDGEVSERPVPPPFPLHTPEGLLPSYSTESGQADLPASASLADISNGVLGPKGEIIPLPTRKHSKSNLLDLLSNVFSSEDEEKVVKEEKLNKKEKLPIGIVNPLYDFEGDVATTLSTEDNPPDHLTIGVSETIRHTDSTDEEEEEAYKNLVEGKYSSTA